MNASPSPERSQPPATRLNGWVGDAWRFLALPLLLFIILPIAMLFVRASPAELIKSLGMEQVYLAVWVSLKTTLISLAAILLLGTPVAYWMGKCNFRLKRVLDTMIDLPTVLPPSVAGVALLMTFGRRGLLGSWLQGMGIEIAFTQTAVVFAQVFIASPFYVRAAALGFANIDLEVEQAAQLDGANRWQVFRYIIFPLSRSALISGGMMSWARALGEFGATIIFAGNFPGRTQTMPTAIYLGFEVDLNIALTLSVILVTISFFSILLVKWLAHRSETP